jgi:hypothetical protein
MAAQTESLYPPVPQRPSDFCSSDGMFGTLANYTQGLLNAYPPVPFFPPNPLSPPVPAADGGAQRHPGDPVGVDLVVLLLDGAVPAEPCIGG